MNVENFFYWLQGGFEWGGANVIDPTSVQIILKHIALVEKVTDGKPGSAILKIKEYLELIQEGISPGKLTDKIRKIVNEQFEHVIDPKAGPQEVQEVLNHIHGKPGMRC